MRAADTCYLPICSSREAGQPSDDGVRKRIRDNLTGRLSHDAHVDGDPFKRAVRIRSWDNTASQGWPKNNLCQSPAVTCSKVGFLGLPCTCETTLRM